MRRVRLTEGQLHRIIRNAVNEAVDDISGDEDVEQRRDKIVETLKKEGYNASTKYSCEDGLELMRKPLPPNMFSIEVGKDFQDEAQQIVDRFHLKKFEIWDPMQNYRLDDSLYCQDGGISGYECDFFL
jgi:hypothetical protein